MKLGEERTAEGKRCPLELLPVPEDTFRRDLHPDLKADFVLANPPFNMSDWARDADDVRWRYGAPPAGNANYAWIQHIVHHLAPRGSPASCSRTGR